MAAKCNRRAEWYFSREAHPLFRNSSNGFVTDFGNKSSSKCVFEDVIVMLKSCPLMAGAAIMDDVS